MRANDAVRYRVRLTALHLRHAMRPLQDDPMNSAVSFSREYADARAKFLAAASDAKAGLETILHPERGPDGGDLATDVAWFGPREAASVLVLISGTHGVEGFCGSGAQVD